METSTAASADLLTACWICGGAARPDPVYAQFELHRCTRCGLLFAPGASVQTAEALYDPGYFEDYGQTGDYDADEAQRRHEARMRVRWLRRHVPAGRVLELGSAAGYFLDELRTVGYEVQGIEPGADLGRRSAERFGIPVQATTVERAELPHDALDAVCAWHVLEHIAAPAGVLARVRAALRPGGRLLVEVPNIDSLHARRQGAAWPKLEMPYHVAHYGPSTLRRLLETAGLEAELVETFPAVGYFRPLQSLRPRPLLGMARDALLLRGNPRRPDPARHELLRAVARRPA
jgi:SAM-dependent methyltransferase